MVLSTVQKHFVYILQLAVHTVQRNWISRLGRYLMGSCSHNHRLARVAFSHILEPGRGRRGREVNEWGKEGCE